MAFDRTPEFTPGRKLQSEKVDGNRTEIETSDGWKLILNDNTQIVIGPKREVAIEIVMLENGQPGSAHFFRLDENGSLGADIKYTFNTDRRKAIESLALQMREEILTLSQKRQTELDLGERKAA